jgi:hypothetical protein
VNVGRADQRRRRPDDRILRPRLGDGLLDYPGFSYRLDDERAHRSGHEAAPLPENETSPGCAADYVTNVPFWNDRNTGFIG